MTDAQLLREALLVLRTFMPHRARRLIAKLEERLLRE